MVVTVRPWALLVVRVTLAVIFAIAAIEKLIAPRTFLRAVRSYQAAPEWAAKLIAGGLPVLELCVALLLVAGVATRAAAVVCSALLLVFMVGVTEAAARGLNLDCGCFGGGGVTTGQTHYTLDLLRDAAMLLGALALVRWPTTRWGLDEHLAGKDKVPEPPGDEAADATRRKYDRMTAARAAGARARRRRVTVLSAAATAVLVLAVGAVQVQRTVVTTVAANSNASATTGVTVGAPGAKVRVVVYEDFQCPSCNLLEQTVGPKVQAMVAAGSVQVSYRIMAFLDSASAGNRYSSRASNAALCAADISTDTFDSLHAVLYGKDPAGVDNQPVENSSGRTNDQLLGYARTAGITGAALTQFRGCMTGEKHKALVIALTDEASKANIVGTPTVLVNGKQLTNPDTEMLPAITAAGGA